MSRLLILIIFFISKVSSSATFLPQELMYKGKPIEAMCIQDIIYSGPSVNLSKCTFVPPYFSKSKIRNDKDLTGYNYIFKDDIMNHDGYSYYRYLGKIDGKIVVYFEEGSGGTGHFSYILLLDREGDNLTKFQIYYGAGDRCNGGLENAYIKDQKIHYSVSITPLDFLGIYRENTKNNSENSPFELGGLIFTALSCYGTATFFDGDFQHIELRYQEEYEPHHYDDEQECFDKIHKQYIDRGHIKLTLSDLGKFLTEVVSLHKKYHPT